MDSVQDEVVAAISEAVGERTPTSRRVVTFGEALVRLTAPGPERLERATSLDVTVGGPELNTAVGLASMGMPVSWVSALSETPLGRMVARAAGGNGVDVSQVRWQRSSRTGLAFVEHAPDPRSSTVFHDTAGSAMADVRPGTFDWASLLNGVAAFHVSGITLGISPGTRAEALEAVRVARQQGAIVSFDLSWRPEQWSEADARQAFMRVVREADVLFASRGGLRDFFGIEGSYESVLRQAITKLGVAAATVSRKRAKGSRRMTLESMAMGTSETLAMSDTQDIEVVDRDGVNDAFAAGFLASYLENPQALSRAVSLGAAACALAYTVPGPFPCATRTEIEALASGDGF